SAGSVCPCPIQPVSRPRRRRPRGLGQRGDLMRARGRSGWGARSVAVAAWAAGSAALWVALPATYSEVRLPGPSRLLGLLPDGRTAVTLPPLGEGDRTGSVQFWSLPDGRPAGELVAPGTDFTTSMLSGSRLITVQPDGDHFRLRAFGLPA